MKGTFAKLALATLLATGLATAAWAFSSGGWGGGDSGCCANGKYLMSNGKWTNVSSKPRATVAAKPKAPAPARPARRTTPLRKKVNFTLKKKKK